MASPVSHQPHNRHGLGHIRQKFVKRLHYLVASIGICCRSTAEIYIYIYIVKSWMDCIWLVVSNICIYLSYSIIYPIGSMYSIYGNIYHQYTPNVSIYTIHGSYGYGIIIPTDFNSMIFQDGEIAPPTRYLRFLYRIVMFF